MGFCVGDWCDVNNGYDTVMSETIKNELAELKELNTKLSKALAEEMASNFKLHSIRQDLQDKLEDALNKRPNKGNEIDTEYLMSLVNQIRCKNTGIKKHINKKGFLEIDGTMINGDHLSFEYLQEKANVIDMLLNTIEKDVLLKSGKFRKLLN